ncbi:MAG: hypothetical protein J2P17_33000 [Mycobacterium sp.]|nr:hypothetical protein [Mycobacterium sp.]
MTTGSGLDGQLAFGEETTWGTKVTPTHAVEFDSESLQLNPTWLEPTGIRSGMKYKRVNRVVQSRRAVSGDFTVEVATKGMGLLWKHALASGATPTQDGTDGAYKQVHTPGDFLGKGLTIQVGRPEPSTGTVQPFTYSGCKVSQWQFSLTDGDIPTLQLTVDGRDEDTATALVTPAYPEGAAVFDFTQASLTLGGTVATAAGLTTVTGGTAVATVITEITLSGEAGMATERYGIGNAGLKSEQLENATPTITGTLSAEFNKTELYDLFTEEGTTPLHLSLVGEQIGASTDHFTLDFILPAVKLKTAQPNVGGPDVVAMSTDIEAYDNETDPVIQVLIWSDETAL